MSRILAMDLPLEHVFKKQICAKRLAVKLILFVGLSQTSFMAYCSVYLTLLITINVPLFKKLRDIIFFALGTI
jgi:hypothetical protein